MIAVSAIAPHPEQPRRHFDEDVLNELAASIAEREHEAFLIANKLLLDARAAQAETSRAAALRALEVAARARASAEDAARFAAAAHELALAEAQSESCAYAVESAAQNAKALENAEGFGLQ